MGTYKCSKCHSDQVESLEWIDLNSGEPMGDPAEVDEYYCRSCEAQTDVVYDTSDNKGLFKNQELLDDTPDA